MSDQRIDTKSQNHDYLDLLMDDLGRQVGEKAVDLASWRAKAQVLEDQLDQAHASIKELEIVCRALESQVSQQVREEIGDHVKGEESPTKE